MTFSESNQDVLPSERRHWFYQQHGYWFSPVILPSHVLEAAERGMRRFYAHDWDAEPTDRDGKALPGWKPADGEGVLRKNDYSVSLSTISLRWRRTGSLPPVPLD